MVLNVVRCLRAAGGIVALGLAFALGCLPPVSGPVDAEVLVKSGAGADDFTLETATLEQVTNILTGEGEDFDIRGGTQFALVDAQLELQDANSTYDDLVELVRANDGTDINPAITYDSLASQWVADDFDGLYYLTILKNFESTWNYYRDVVGDRSGATQEKGLVGFYGGVVMSSVVPLPHPAIPPADNAAYYPPADGWLTLRVHAQEGIPLAMNEGVVAHEFQHRIWHHNVIVGPAYDAWRRSQADPDYQELAGSALLLRGVDEGLADIFAVGMSGDPAFMSPSLEDSALSPAPIFSTVAAYRDLEGEFANDYATYDRVLVGDVGVYEDQCGRLISEDGDTGGVVRFNPYCLGTVLAKTLWDASGKDPERLRTAFLPFVNQALSDTGEAIAAASESNNAYSFEVHYLLNAIAFRLGPGARADFCTEADYRFQSLVESGAVPLCL